MWSEVFDDTNRRKVNLYDGIARKGIATPGMAPEAFINVCMNSEKSDTVMYLFV